MLGEKTDTLLKGRQRKVDGTPLVPFPHRARGFSLLHRSQLLSLLSRMLPAIPRRLQWMFTDRRMRPLILALWFSALSIAVIAVSGEAEGASPSCDQALQKSETLLTWKRPDGEREPRTVLEWDEKALSALSNIDSEIAVVSITGPQRSGKSYFLNRLAKQISQRPSDPASPEGVQEEPGREWEDPFDTSTTMNAGKGDVSVHIIPGCANPLPESPGTALLLLDTPGMRTLQRSALQDAQVMALVEAVSSVVLYNTLPVVERTDFQLLSTALEASRALDVLCTIDHGSGNEGDYESDGVQEKKAGEGDQEEDEASQKGDGGKYDGEGGDAPELPAQKPGMNSRPSLVWLLQQSTPKADKVDQAKDYVDGLLQSAWDGESFKNAFNGFFTKWDVAALPKPLTDVERWPVLNTVSESDLSDEYTKSVEGVVEMILSACTPKTLDGTNVGGKDLVDFLRRSSKAVDIQTGDEDEDLESPTLLLEALEDQELDIAKKYFKNFIEDKLPLGSVDLKGIQKEAEEFLLSRFTINPRSPPLESQPDSPSLRRAAFVKKFYNLMTDAYKDTCETNALEWSITEVAALQKEFEELKGPEVQRSHQGDEEMVMVLPPNHEDVIKKLNARNKRWIEKFEDIISHSHEDFESKDSDFAKGGKFTNYHRRKLEVATDDFLVKSLADVKQKASDWFSDELELLNHQAGDASTLDDVQHLAKKATELVDRAFSMVMQAVGGEKAKKVKAEEDWEGLAIDASDRWLKEKDGSEEIEGQGGGDEEQNDGKGGHDNDNDNDNDKGGHDNDNDNGNASGNGQVGKDKDGTDININNGDGRADDLGQANPAGEGVDALVRRLVEVDFKPCILKIEPDDSDWVSSMDSCRRSVNDQWKTSGAVGFELDQRLDKVVNEHIESSLERIVEGILEEVDAHVPLYKQTRHKYEQAVKARKRDKKGMLVNPELVSKLKESSKIRIIKAWNKKCEEAGKKHIAKAKAATSIFSLAPLRYFGAVPFQPADCLEGEARVEAAVESRDKARSKYYRGSWVRRYIVTLSLVCTFFLTLVAVALLVAGRQLQHRQVAMAFVAATAFHVIVLCLAVSDGLMRGTRLWLLVSAGVLGYVASGSTVSMVGGKRGRGSTRYPVWSAVGIRRWTGFSNGGSLMPLFRGSGASERGAKVPRERESRTRHTD